MDAPPLASSGIPCRRHRQGGSACSEFPLKVRLFFFFYLVLFKRLIRTSLYDHEYTPSWPFYLGRQSCRQYLRFRIGDRANIKFRSNRTPSCATRFKVVALPAMLCLCVRTPGAAFCSFYVLGQFAPRILHQEPMRNYRILVIGTRALKVFPATCTSGGCARSITVRSIQDQSLKS